ncbi:helicase HerA domain-containing protein [Nostoc sp. UHCC 0870]|uniref:helicase HerA domain-containing protein n=1 Tax=Nostoc sp. UHCC 0870 TaxID=2914041 RepID=UPI001EDE9683|nr:DUF87 domain-containing protein [Nostoc sp. UHCC 0870]UKP01458.1 ATP-binding protein [Nostoc sp. UHCC 0870]
MTSLSDQHENLAKNQQSQCQQWFNQLPFDTRIAVIGMSLILALFSTAQAWRGEISSRIYFCILTQQQELKCRDKNNRPYRMTVWHWQQWQQDGMPTFIVPNTNINYQGLVKAANSSKPVWAGAAFLCFATAGWMLRHLQDQERQLFNFQAIVEKRDLARAEIKAKSELLDDYHQFNVQQIRLQSELDMITNEQVIDIQKAEILAEVEIQITQMEAADIKFEAEVAGMSPQDKEEYIKFLRQQKTPYLQGTQTLQATVNPGDKINPSEQPPAISSDEPAPSPLNSTETFNPWDYANANQLPQEYRWLREFISNTALVLGSQGSGKSWFVRVLALLKKLKGYRVIIFDPNSNQGEWMGMEFYGSYEEIQEQMKWYVGEIQNRYNQFRQSTISELQWREKLWREGKAFSIICEEYSTYTDFIEDKDLIKKFVKSANTLSRKQEAPVTFVTHNLSKECLGNVDGLFDIFKRMQRLFLDATTDPKTDQPVAAGTGRIKAVDADELREVFTPKLAVKITDFRTESEQMEDARQMLRRYEQMEGITNSSETVGSSLAQPSKPHLSDNVQKLYNFLKRTNRMSAKVKDIQPNFKVKGQRFSVDELTRFFNEIVEAELAEWVATGVIQLK